MDGSNNEKTRGPLRHHIWEWLNRIAAIATIGAVVPLIYQAIVVHITVLFMTFAVAISITLLYIFLRKTTVQSGLITPGRSVRVTKRPFYSKWVRRVALAGAIAIPSLLGLNLALSYYYKSQPPDKIVILVADFDGSESEKYRVTETVLEGLRMAVRPYHDVRIEALGRSIKETEVDQITGKKGTDAAREVGQQEMATIVIWGWYGTTTEVAPLSVHIELLQPLGDYQVGVGSVYQGQLRILSRKQLESFVLQTQLSKDINYVSLFVAGMSRYAQADWAGAIARFDDAMNQTSEELPAEDRSQLYFLRGYAYSSSGDTTQALSDFDRAIQLHPNLPEAYINRGTIYKDKGEYDRAIIEYTQAILLSPDVSDFYNVRGVGYHEHGDYDSAIADYDQALRLQPNNIDVYINRGASFRAKGDYDRAIADYDYALSINPNDALAYNNRGTAHYNKSDYDIAINDFNQAIRLDPELVAAYIGRGLVYDASGNYENAVADYTHAIELEPSTIDAYLFRAMVRNEQGDYDSAISDCNYVLSQQPDSADAYNERGWAYYNKSAFEKAISDLSQAIKYDGQFVEAYVNRGAAYAALSKHVEAIADYTEAIRLGVLSSSVYFNRGVLYSREAQYDKAIADLNQALLLQPNTAKYFMVRGIAY